MYLNVNERTVLDLNSASERLLNARLLSFLSRELNEVTRNCTTNVVRIRNGVLSLLLCELVIVMDRMREDE